jgi:hypothetical protein
VGFLACDPKAQSLVQTLFMPAYRYPRYSQDGPRDTHDLQLAARFGQDVLVEDILCEPGTDPNPVDGEQRTPLILAVTPAILV